MDQKIVFRSQSALIRSRFRKESSAQVSEIPWLRNYRDIAAFEKRKCKMRDSFFRSNQRNDLGEWIKADPETFLHPFNDRFAIVHQSQSKAVPVHCWSARCSGEDVH